MGMKAGLGKKGVGYLIEPTVPELLWDFLDLWSFFVRGG